MAEHETRSSETWQVAMFIHRRWPPDPFKTGGTKAIAAGPIDIGEGGAKSICVRPGGIPCGVPARYFRRQSAGTINGKVG